MQAVINPRARNLVTVCIDSADARELGGRLYATGRQAPRRFSGSSTLLLEMESYFDEIGFPQAALKPRSFRKRAESPAEEKQGREETAMDNNTERRGEKGTFVVQVQYRQNATWQGSVHWAEKNITQQFRSALELLKLIDSALDAGEE